MTNELEVKWKLPALARIAENKAEFELLAKKLHQGFVAIKESNESNFGELTDTVHELLQFAIRYRALGAQKELFLTVSFAWHTAVSNAFYKLHEQCVKALEQINQGREARRDAEQKLRQLSKLQADLASELATATLNRNDAEKRSITKALEACTQGIDSCKKMQIAGAHLITIGAEFGRLSLEHSQPQDASTITLLVIDRLFRELEAQERLVPPNYPSQTK